MKAITPYLCFDGTCRAAMEFYQSALNGKIESIQTVGETPTEAGPEMANRVMHAHLVAGELHLMASDSMPHQPLRPGSQVALSLHFEDEAEQTKIFVALAEGGKVTMELQDTFWGARFGMLTDRFGIDWMLNCEKKPA